MIYISDQIRPEAQNVITRLHKMGIKVYVITGDNKRTALHVASLLEIAQDHVIYDCLPSDKVNKIRMLQQQNNQVVAMVGDGINDAPALAQADVGIAIASGTDIATEAADLVLMKSNLTAVVIAIHLSRVIVRRIYLNLGWALLYNIIAIPLAAGVLLPVTHQALPPYIAGLSMAMSSVSVLVSSLLLYCYKKPNITSNIGSVKRSHTRTGVEMQDIRSSHKKSIESSFPL